MPLSRLVDFLPSRSLTRDKSKYGKHCGIEGPSPASHSSAIFAEQRLGISCRPEDAATNTTSFPFTMKDEDDVQSEAVDDFILDREYPGSDDGGAVREDQSRIVTIRNISYLVTVVATLESSVPCLFSAHYGNSLSFNVIPPPDEVIQIGHSIAPFLGPQQFLVRVVKVLGVAPRQNASLPLLSPSVDHYCVTDNNTGNQELMKIRAMYEYPKQSLATQPSIVVHSDGCNGRKVISFAHVPSYRYLAEVRRTLPYYDEEVTFDADDISTQSLSSGVTDVPLADPVRPDFFTTQDECRINDWIEGTQLASATLPAIPLPAASTCPADSCTSTQAVVGSYLPKGWPSKRLWHFCVDHGFSTHTHSRQAHGSFFSHNSPDPEDASCALTSALPPVGVMMDEDGAVRASRDAERTEEMLRIFEEFTNPEVLMRDVRPGLGLRDESSYGWLPKQHERAERWEVNGRRVQGQGKMLLGSCADGFEF